MARSTTLQPGEELRGFRVKLYPTQDELRYLGAAQAELMAAWNVLVTSRETHVEHCVRHAEDTGLVGPAPPRPASDRASDEPAARAEWTEYERACALRRYEAVRLTRDVPGLEWNAWRVDYKTLRELFGGRQSVASAQMFLALVDTFRKTKGARLKRRPLEMPLLNRTGGHAIVLVTERRCVVAFGPLRIKARYHRPPPGPFIEGVSIRLEKDGWYAAARCRVVPAPLPEPTREIIAINAGLECLYADNFGHTIDNPRGNAFSLRVAELSAWVDAADDPWQEAFRRNQLARYQERFARRTKDLIYSQVLPRLAPYATILIGQTGQEAAQGVQTRISRNAEGGYVSAMSILREAILLRYGDADESPTGRARVVPSMGISRRCSRCGTEHPTRYNRDNSRRHDQMTDCRNPSCLERIHVDVNAARNLLANYTESRRAAQ